MMSIFAAWADGQVSSYLKYLSLWSQLGLGELHALFLSASNLQAKQ